MGGLALAKVRYDQHLRFVLPLVGILVASDRPGRRHPLVLVGPCLVLDRGGEWTK